MKNILYIGNKLNSESKNPSSIEVLGQLLKAEGYALKYASSYQNKILRFIDMVFSCVRYSKWADAVLIDTYSTQNFYFAYACSQVCKWFKTPYFPILHGGNLPERLKSSPKLCKEIFSNAEKNISPSLYLKTEFKKFGFENIEFVPNSIKIENYPLKNKSFKTIKLLWVRSFSKIYNPEMAIKVFKNLIDLGFKTELCMVGPDADGIMENLKRFAEKLGVKPKFTGKLTKEEWTSLAADYNIFINTTNFDNMPVSVIEAMALGFPVVSTKVGGISYLIEDNIDGLLVEKDNVKQMTKAIISVFEDKKLQVQLSGNAQKKAETFDWQIVREKWHKILKTQ